jgi:putative FmdB family regulatory protein
MPLYEYECDSCGHRFEVIQKFSDALADKCPKCGSTVHKLFSSPAIQFKGSGWYITDYAKKGRTDSSGSADSGAEKKTDGGEKGATSSDAAAKPAPAPPTSKPE